MLTFTLWFLYIKYLVFLDSYLFMSLPSFKVIHDYKIMLSVSCQASIILYFLKNPIPLRNLIIIFNSQSFLSSVLISLLDICFFLLFLHWGQSCRQCFIISLWFPNVGGCSFLDIKCPWVNLV